MAAAVTFGSKPEMISASQLGVVYRVAHASEAIQQTDIARVERGEEIGDLLDNTDKLDVLMTLAGDEG